MAQDPKMDHDKLKANFKISQWVGAFGIAGGLTFWKLYASFDPRSPYQNFVNSPDFNPFMWVAASAVFPCVVGVGMYFVLGSVFKKQLAKYNAASSAISPQKDSGISDEQIVSDFAALMEKGTIGAAFYDVLALPHPKESILIAIEHLIVHEPLDARVEFLKICSVCLPHFQVGIGPKPLFWVGVDLVELGRTTPDLKEQAMIIANNPDRERTERFLAEMGIENNQIQTRVDAALRQREARMKRSGLLSADTSAEAQFQMGNKYISGREASEDYKEAAKWYRKAAEQGHAMAQTQLGHMYVSGEGVLQNYMEASRWYHAAAESGIAVAQMQLGDMHIKGQGVSQDYGEAAKWCSKAAKQGNPMAQMLLGGLYHNGQGVPRDYVLAQMWLTLAASSFPPSKADQIERVAFFRQHVAAKMTESQIAQARDLAHEWKVG